MEWKPIKSLPKGDVLTPVIVWGRECGEPKQQMRPYVATYHPPFSLRVNGEIHDGWQIDCPGYHEDGPTLLTVTHWLDYVKPR